MECLWGEYMATCVPGGESVLAEELGELYPGAKLREERGKVFMTLSGKERDMTRSRCADNVYRVLARFTVGPHKDDLPAVEAFTSRLDLSFLKKKGKRLRVSASRAGKHTYSRFALAEAAARGMARQGFVPVGEEDEFDTALRLDLAGEDAMLAVQLTDAAFRFRSDCFLSAPGGLRPTVARMLVRISCPEPEDVFLDPFCGAGTIPFERAAAGPAKSITAADIDPEPLSLAKKNLAGKAATRLGDAQALPEADESVDCVVTNLPWGKQIEVDDLPGLYDRFAEELKRVLVPGGRAVLLTDRDEETEQALKKSGLSAKIALRLSLHGLHPAVWVVVKSNR